MTSHNFLPDENILVYAFTHTNAARFWEQIASNCHVTLVSVELSRRYWSAVQRRRNKTPNDQQTEAVVRAFHLLHRDSRRSIWLDDGAAWTNHAIRHHGDWFFEPIATSFDAVRAPDETCMFVSRDKRTRDDFNKPQLVALGFSGVTLEVGIQASADPGCE